MPWTMKVVLAAIRIDWATPPAKPQVQPLLALPEKLG
jgi:hypothetical protein